MRTSDWSSVVCSSGLAAEHDLSITLLPEDVANERAAMLEIRAGAGGDEAALFAGDLLRMSNRYADGQSWKVEIISANETEVGGYKEVVASASGQGGFRSEERG